MPNEKHIVRWHVEEPRPIGFRDKKTNEIPTPLGCSDEQYTWIIPYSFKVPKGYSLLVTHPFNRHDLPFVTLTGIIDADSILGAGNYPFYVKKDFNGIIEEGTPIIQITPIKRENWIIEESPKIKEIAIENQTKSDRKFFGYYKKNQWKKKSYE